MRIGIVGTGSIGGTFARLLVRSGHEVVLANSRGPDSLTGLVAELGDRASAATVEDAVRGADLVVVAVPFGRYGELPPEPFAGRVVIDPGNYDIPRDGHNEELDRGEITTGQLLARQLPGATVVKAFNTIWFRHLLEDGRPDAPAADRRAIPVAADDPVAKQAVFRLVEELGFAPVDTGSLADCRRQELGTPVFNQAVGPDRARELLEST
jgi:predicted dinucleotide-binding enzyme